MNIFIIISSYVILAGVSGFLGYLLIKERRHSSRVEARLLNRIMAKDLTDLANNHRMLAIEPEDEKDLMKLENDLAVAAAEIERKQNERLGIPIT